MKLLPYEQYNLYTRLSPEEVRQRLADNTEQGGKKKPLGGKTVKPFRGEITNETFSISPVIDYRNSFLPVLKGTYFRENGMTRIRTRLQLNDVVLAFCIIWLGIVGLCGILLPISELRGALNGKRFDPMVLVPTGMFVFGYLLMIAAFNTESTRSKKLLAKVLDAQPD